MKAPLTATEYACVLAFADWWGTLPAPHMIATERTVWGQGYAGTIDLIAEWGGDVWIVDFKTSQDVWPEHELQVTAYGMAMAREETEWRDPKLAILQVGYRRNKRGWKFTEITPQPDLFRAVQAIWAKETAGQQPSQREYPLRIKLA